MECQSHSVFRFWFLWSAYQALCNMIYWLTTGPKAIETTDHRLQSPNLSQNLPFLSLRCLSQGFCYTNRSWLPHEIKNLQVWGCSSTQHWIEFWFVTSNSDGSRALENRDHFQSCWLHSFLLKASLFPVPLPSPWSNRIPSSIFFTLVESPAWEINEFSKHLLLLREISTNRNKNHTRCLSLSNPI